MREITTAFCVNGQWYEMPYNMCKAIQSLFGADWTNSKIIEWIMQHKSQYDFGHTGNVITINYQNIANP